ncbi:MAG: DMT family transporter [Eggerthellaceae bacterium]|nr:DMT family transporter [Eggerthellaceae bacterium]
MKNSKGIAIVLALLAAVLYALNAPASKVLLATVEPMCMAALLYLGAGVGVGILSLFNWGARQDAEPLSKQDVPYVLGMIVLDIVAPILLMVGINLGTASNASLLGNFEIVATTVVALAVFKEAVSRKLWFAIGLITLASIILSFGGTESLSFSYGSLFVLAATVCWGFENNCTRMLSSKDTYQIVVLKGIFSGLCALGIALVMGEHLPAMRYIALAMLLGFVAYGLSIFFYVRAQRELGAAKTSAYYAVAPFVGAFLSFVLLQESLTPTYAAALLVMVAGTALVVVDTLQRNHAHAHRHSFVHTHDGTTHEHTIEHSHDHTHYVTNSKHAHTHTLSELEHEINHAS